MNWTELIIPLLTGILTFVATIVTVSIQSKRNKEEQKLQYERDVATRRLEQERLQQDIETDLWKRLREEIERVQAELNDERRKGRDLETRLAKVINENIKLQGLVEQLQALVEKLRSENQQLMEENEALVTRIRVLERRVGTGPLAEN